jgi:hypothetical protein
MKKLAIVLSLAALAGCAAPPPGPAYYGSRAYAQPVDQSQWRVVSVTPVAPGTGARAAANSDTGSSPNVQYSPAPSANTGQPVYVQQPVYVEQPVYVAPPIYAPAPVYDPYPYYWGPPISIGLGFSWSHFSGGHRGWGGRGWGGHGGGFRHR